MKIAQILDHAAELRREVLLDRPAPKSPDVPFVPKPPEPGWQDLDEIAAEFAGFSQRYDAVEDALFDAEIRRRKRKALVRKPAPPIAPPPYRSMTPEDRRAKTARWAARVAGGGAHSMPSGEARLNTRGGV